MSSPNPIPDPIERMLLEAVEADRAGVFGRTSVDPASLLTEASPVKASWFVRHRQAVIGLPVAACLAFVAILGTLEYGGGTTVTSIPVAIHEGTIASPAAVSRPSDLLLSCFTGPGQGPVSIECASADYDQDGDIDLVDYGALQLEEATGPIQ